MAGPKPNPKGRKSGRPTAPALNPRAPRLPPEWKATFLKVLSETGHVGKACEAANVSRTEVWHQRKGLLADVEFGRAYDEAKLRFSEIRVDMLEEELLRRSHDGVDEPVFFGGAECGKIRKYSDSLLQFALRSLKPDTYRDSLNINMEKLDAQIEKGLAELTGQNNTEDESNGPEAS